ncbi:MAG: phosphoglucosamine mutase [Clostridia bacterium]|nr:phosphoglucosamine mutase [Clostridia bacterium]
MGRLFGTDGVRGVANTELTPELAYKLGQAGAYVITSETKHTPKILIGKDTRISSDMLEAALIAGICSVGAEAVCLGVIPTPAVAYLTRLYNADAGVVISASHNPFEFNGIKFFDNRGYKLPDAMEDEIEAIILNGIHELPKPSGKNIGVKTVRETALSDYTDYLKSTVGYDLKGLKVAVDCANGAAFEAASMVLSGLGAELYIIHNKPDGVNINKGCGSTHMEELQMFTVDCGADIGLAFDGDADRMLAVDEKGNVIDGDVIMAILGVDLKSRGKLTGNTIVATIVSNLGFDIMAKREEINVAKTVVGDRYVLEEMLSKGYALGGEQSGHIILLEYNTTGDGILSGLQLLRIMKTSGKKISELAAVMQVLPQVLKNAKVSNDKKYKYLEDESIAKKCRDIEAEFHGHGRVLVRPSGTEPLVRVMIEGKDQQYITSKAVELAKFIEERLN